MYSEDDLIPVSLIADFIYCPRRAALHHIEGIWEDNLYTAEGTILHEKADIEGKTESRVNLGIARGLRVRSMQYGLIGKMDIVEFHRVESGGITLQNTTGLWQPFPVEYKRGIMRHEKSFEMQLCAQAICLEEMLGSMIPNGAIFYGKSEHRIDIKFDENLRKETLETINSLQKLIQKSLTPKAEYNKRCERCSLKNLCMPESMQKGVVEKYLENFT